MEKLFEEGTIFSNDIRGFLDEGAKTDRPSQWEEDKTASFSKLERILTKKNFVSPDQRKKKNN